MPERIAISRITIGEGDKENKRRMIMPGQRFQVTDAQAKELDAYNPPIVRDPRAARRVDELAGHDDEMMAAHRVAQPDPGPGVTDNSNVTREPAVAQPDEKDEL